MCAAASDGDKIARQDDECRTTTEILQERWVDAAMVHAIYIILQLLRCKSESCRRPCEWIDAIQGLSASTLQVLSCLHGSESGNQKTAGLTDQRGLTHVSAALLLFVIALPLLVSWCYPWLSVSGAKEGESWTGTKDGRPGGQEEENIRRRKRKCGVETEMFPVFSTWYAGYFWRCWRSPRHCCRRHFRSCCRHFRKSRRPFRSCCRSWSRHRQGQRQSHHPCRLPRCFPCHRQSHRRWQHLQVSKKKKKSFKIRRQKSELSNILCAL